MSVRKRKTRKWRHSKIVTAQGPRDRRMRLNLEVASQFFAIQDMLGCDKASKTITWLMKEASSSIEKLKAASKLKGKSNEECEFFTTQQEIEDVPTKTKKRASRRTITPATLTKESRAMARERARERTKAKRDINNILLNTLIPTGVLDEESGSHDVMSSYDLVNANHVEEEQCSPANYNPEELSVSILDYYNMATYFSPMEQYWMNELSSYGDEQMQTRMW